MGTIVGHVDRRRVAISVSAVCVVTEWQQAGLDRGMAIGLLSPSRGGVVTTPAWISAGPGDCLLPFALVFVRLWHLLVELPGEVVQHAVEVGQGWDAELS